MKYYWLGATGVLLLVGLIYFSPKHLLQFNKLEQAVPIATTPSSSTSSSGDSAASQNNSSPPADGLRTLEWEELMPADDLALLEAMEPIDHANMSESELAKDQQAPPTSLKPTNGLSQFEIPKKDPANKTRTWQDALVSNRTRPELNQQNIKIAGYIVPLEYNAEQLLTDFFLVPYFGACIHVPPPQPNQIIYVRIPKGLPAQDIYTPYWVQGTLKIETQERELGVSSYSLDATSVEAYTEEFTGADQQELMPIN
jgi:hypothetical protein